MAYDGEVRIKTKVDTSQMQRLQVQIDKAALKVENLSKKYEQLKNQKIHTDGYSALENKLKSAQVELTKLIAEEEKLSAAGLSIGAPWDNIIAKEADAQLKIEAIQAEMQKLVETGRAFTVGGNKDEISKAADELGIAKAELRALVTKQDELNAKTGKLTKKTYEASNGLKRIGEVGKKAFSGLHRNVNKSNGLFRTFGSRLRGILLSLLVFNWITKGFNAMVSGLKEGYKNLVKYSDEYNRSMSALQSASTQMKNSLATAFAPIVQAAIPYLITLINYVTAAANAVSQFFAVLSGKSTWIKAIAVQENYAGSLNGTAAAAKKAAGALASFDTLEVLNKQDTSGGSGGAGAGLEDMFEEVPVENNSFTDFAKRLKELIAEDDWYGLGALLGEKLNEALEGIDWDKIKASARKIAYNLAHFLNGFLETPELFYNLGVTLAQALNTAFEFLYTFATEFHWDSLGSAIAQSINGFFATFDFVKAGLTLSTLAIGFLTAFNTALEETDWNQVGQSVVDFLAAIDWIGLLLQLVETGSALDSAIMELAQGFAESFAEHLVNFISESLQDPSKIQELAETYFEWLYYSPFTKILTMPFVLTYQFGKAIIDGIIKGIEENSIWEGVKYAFETFVESVKDFLGIHSPSTVFQEIGWYLIEGLILGLTEIWENLTYFFSEDTWLELAANIYNGISQTWEELVTWWDTNIVAWWDNSVAPWFTVEKWKALGEAMKKGIYNGFAGIVNKIVDVLNNAITSIENFVNAIIDKINELINKIKASMGVFAPPISHIGSISFGRVPKVEIPALANGAVLRGGNPFLAILGDQRAGQTNIEAPQSAIEDAVAAGMSRAGAYGGGTIEINLNYDGETFARLSLKDILSEMNRQGYDIDVLGGMA